jgi:hypothetical protein
MLTIEPTATAFWARRLGKGVGQHLLMSDRFRGNKLPSDELSDNRHGQRRTPADTHRRTTAGHACRAALTVRVGTWLRDEEANASTPKCQRESHCSLVKLPRPSRSTAPAKCINQARPTPDFLSSHRGDQPMDWP